MNPIRGVPNEVHFPSLEREVLERWKADATFEKSVRAREGRPSYVFYDGPPFATGLPHYGHILTSYVKDVVPRFFTMRGYHVPRRWGWDCHGLPVEFEVEKELGFKSRTDILNYGIAPFNEQCRAMVLRYATEWRTIIERLGRWVDFDHDYRTMDADYIESVIWVFKSLWERALVYEGQKVVVFCTRCQTTLSNFEAKQDDAFRPRTDPAVTVRFQFADDPAQSLLAWTTTPWTLPSNVALAVASDVVYQALTKAGETVWLAKDAVARYAHELSGWEPSGEALGATFLGRHYRPLFPWFADTPHAFQVVAADFVSTDDGSGIVHMAPAFGEDDAAVCATYGIEGPNPVRDDGTFDERVVDFAGEHVLAANDGIIRLLRAQGAIFKREQYVHNYPHCWRCDSPLIYRGVTTWFVKVSEIKTAMVAANQQIRWAPEHIRDGRFGNWLENARDWAISRNRFWGAPVPIWRCAQCATTEAIGSRQELEQRSGLTVTDWHRPAIDAVTFPCACGGTMVRISDVLDCWFESGSMPYGQVHYPFERKREFEAAFPGDFIVEYIAQTRGWFYTLVVLGAALFDERPFKNAMCHGVILADDGRKMSKRLKNYPDPMELVETHGSDALRIALLDSVCVRGADVRFSADSVRDAVRRFCIPAWNCLHYFTAYAEIDRFVPQGVRPASSRLDRYLLSETERLRQTLEDLMVTYDVMGCYIAIEEYLVMLSTWYVRLSKRVFWKSGMPEDKHAAFEALYAALSTFTRLAAPFLPFLTEKMHEALGGAQSVHLEDWPAAMPGWRDHDLSTEMRDVRSVVRLVRSVREAHHVSHRQPLRSVAVAHLPEHAIRHNLELLLDELNVKEIRRLESLEGHVKPQLKLDYPRLGKRLRGGVKNVQKALDEGRYQLLPGGTGLVIEGHELGADEFHVRYEPAVGGTGVAAEGLLVVVVDLTLDPGLLVEKQMRDLNRGLQDLRKEAGLRYQDRIRVSILAPDALTTGIAGHLDWLAEQTLAVEVEFLALDEPDASKEIEVGGERVTIMLSLVGSGDPQ
jgi:isoleucyl-tRNA synthetase